MEQYLILFAIDPQMVVARNAVDPTNDFYRKRLIEGVILTLAGFDQQRFKAEAAANLGKFEIVPQVAREKPRRVIGAYALVLFVSDLGAMPFCDIARRNTNHFAAAMPRPIHRPGSMIPVPARAAAAFRFTRTIGMTRKIAPPAGAIVELGAARGVRRAADELPISVVLLAEYFRQLERMLHRRHLAVAQLREHLGEVTHFLDADQQI